jgi:tetratricopeptide (TPR) repeat protein
MAEDFPTADEPLSAAQARRLNATCDRFEAACKAAVRGVPAPRIEDYLAGAPVPERAALLRHLLLLEIDYRRLRGETPIPADYQARFPTLSERILADLQSSPPAGAAAAAGADRPAAGGAPGDEDGDQGANQLSTVMLPPFSPRFRSDRYAVRQFHARGGVGEVWLAEDVEIGRCVALKRLRPKREHHQDRFLAEAQITGQLEHPGVVPVHDLGLDEEGRPFYVMSFVHGRTLKDVIEEDRAGAASPKEPPEVRLCRFLEIFVKVCQTVAYAHSRGVLHRDLKPDNIMLGPYGETLVLDWGLAKVRSQPDTSGTSSSSVHLTYGSGSLETEAGVVMGSPPYMAPEVADGQAADAGERTDVYLLGATLYHILTDRPPREGTSREEIVELARTVSPPPPRKLRPDIPRALEAICLQAMARRKQDRYATALELADDVQRFLAGAPVAAYPESLPLRAWRWCKRHRRALGRSLAGAVVLGATLLGTALVRDAWRKQEELRRAAEVLRRCEQARQDLADFRRLTDERQFYAAATTPAGERLLHYDSRRGEALGRDAIDRAERLLRDSDDLPLEPERQALRKELHDLLLLTVQSQGDSPPDTKAVPELLERLERARALQGPSRSYHRLRAQRYRGEGDDARAADEQKQAEGLPFTALDHFLEAELDRVRALAPAETQAASAAWKPNPALLDRAITHYRKALEIEPDQFWCHLQLGRCYLSRGQGSEALEALGTCVALRPRSPWGYSARGLALGLTGRFADGEADLGRALALEPDFRPALLNRGLLSWLQRKYDAAAADFTRVLEPPEQLRLIEAAYYRGQLHLERGQQREALQDFDLVAREDPGFRPVYLSRAQVHFLLGDDNRGLADLTTFLDLAAPKPLDPKDPKVFALRGRLLRHLVPGWRLPPADSPSKLELARSQLDGAVKRGDQSAEVLDDLGSVLEFLGRPEEARAWYGQALAAAPPDLKVKILMKRAWLQAQSLAPPDYDGAREDFAVVLRLDPGNADAHAGLAYLGACQRKPLDAQREAAEALLHGGGDYLVLHNLACAYAELSRTGGQTKEHQDVAVDLLRRAVELWRRGGAGLDERELIRQDEKAFKPLEARPDFRKLRAGDGP